MCKATTLFTMIFNIFGRVLRFAFPDFTAHCYATVYFGFVSLKDPRGYCILCGEPSSVGEFMGREFVMIDPPLDSGIRVAKIFSDGGNAFKHVGVLVSVMVIACAPFRATHFPLSSLFSVRGFDFVFRCSIMLRIVGERVRNMIAWAIFVYRGAGSLFLVAALSLCFMALCYME